MSSKTPRKEARWWAQNGVGWFDNAVSAYARERDEMNQRPANHRYELLPISTAPKDRMVMIWRSLRPRGLVIDCRCACWNETTHAWDSMFCGPFGDDVDAGGWTHWSELPAPHAVQNDPLRGMDPAEALIHLVYIPEEVEALFQSGAPCLCAWNHEEGRLELRAPMLSMQLELAICLVDTSEEHPIAQVHGVPNPWGSLSGDAELSLFPCGKQDCCHLDFDQESGTWDVAQVMCVWGRRAMTLLSAEEIDSEVLNYDEEQLLSWIQHTQ